VKKVKKVTTFSIDFDLWKKFQKKLIDNSSPDKSSLKGSNVISNLIKDFLSGKIKVELLETKPVSNPHMVALHIDEKYWLELDEWLVRERKKYIGNKEKQNALSKGKIITKLIEKYVE